MDAPSDIVDRFEASWRKLCPSTENEDRNSAIITDQNEHLPQFCKCFEQVMLCRFKASRRTMFGMNKLELWQMFLLLSKYCRNQHLSRFYNDIIEHVKRCSKLKTYQGRGRAFIRLSLTKGLLFEIVQTLVNSALVTSFYELESILQSQRLKSNFMTILKQVSEAKFDLPLANVSFLDESWIIPIHKLVQMQYSSDIGLLVRHINDRAVVVKIDPQSPAANTDIEPGDVLDQIFGESLYMVRVGTINDIMKRYRDQSIPILIIKKYLPNGLPFDPIASRLDQIYKTDNIVISKEKSKPSPKQKPQTDGEFCRLPSVDETLVQAPNDGNLYSVIYMGSANMGRKGDKAFIEDGIKSVIDRKDPDIAVTIELNEGYAVVKRTSSKDEPLLRFSYTEISSCGRLTYYPGLFAFIAGDTTCTISENFTCHVFKATSEEMAKTLLGYLVEGFSRTCWSV